MVGDVTSIPGCVAMPEIISCLANVNPIIIAIWLFVNS